jgi:hypothetical protein
VGVDWASESHHVRITDCHGKVLASAYLLVAAQASPKWPLGSRV